MIKAAFSNLLFYDQKRSHTIFLEGPPSLKHSKYSECINDAVNLQHVFTVRKSRMKWYPDNEGVPSIKFWMGGENKVEWIYSNEKARDEAFHQIINQ